MTSYTEIYQNLRKHGSIVYLVPLQDLHRQQYSQRFPFSLAKTSQMKFHRNCKALDRRTLGDAGRTPAINVPLDFEVAERDGKEAAS